MAKIILKIMSYTSNNCGYLMTMDVPDDVVFFEVESQYCNTTHYEGFHNYVGISRDQEWFDGVDNERTYNNYDIDCIGNLLFINLHNVLFKDVDESRLITREEAHKMFGLRDMVVAQWRKSNYQFYGIHRIREYLGDACIVVDSIINNNDGEFAEDGMKTLVKNNILYAGQIANNERSTHITAIDSIKRPYIKDLYNSTLSYVCNNLRGRRGLPKYDLDFPLRVKRNKPDVGCGRARCEDYIHNFVDTLDMMFLYKELPQNI